MKPALKTKWLKALRSKKYKQGQNYLRNRDNTFCCLGVLCDLVNPNGWCEKPDTFCISFGKQEVMPSEYFYRKVGLTANFADHLAELNDYGDSFKQIARVIEKHL